MNRVLPFLLVAILGQSSATAQVTASDASYYDFWLGEWHQVIDGRVASEARFIVEEGLYPEALEEHWQMEGYKAKGWRAWDSSRKTWTFVWMSERGHFQIWNERKVDGAWYMFRTFVIDGEEVLSRQAFLPQSDGAVIRTSEHSRDGGKTWTLRFEERYVKVGERGKP